MNFVYLSPHFPANFFHFCTNLNILGVNVLGIADESYDRLRPELRYAIREYFRVDDMHSYDQLLRACGYFTHRYGKIDRIDSHNEYWLDTEAKLRTDFNIFGPKLVDMGTFKRKSRMKKIFLKAGVNVPRGKVAGSLQEAKTFTSEVGYPIVVKSDVGVGAIQTYKINTERELLDFIDRKPALDFIMEEFITGKIFTFDGLTDLRGNAVFYTSHTYNFKVMEAVNDDALFFYYSLKTIPDDLVEAGLKVVKEFRIRQRFFHFEFFREAINGKLLALEANIRPPGGLTTDMFNFANDIDIYKEWANIVVYNRFNASYSRQYHCGYISRKYNRDYKHSHGDVMARFGDRIMHHEEISGVFSPALGNYGYLVRSSELAEISEIAAYIQSTL